MFAIVTVALVASFGLLPDTAEVAVIDAGADGDDDGAGSGDAAPEDLDDAEGSAGDPEPQPTTTTSDPPPVRVSQAMRYELAMSALAIHDAVSIDDGSSDEPPSSPTTAAPTTAAPTTAPTTTAPAPSSSDTTAAEATTTTVTDGTDTSDTTDTTAPGDTATSETTDTTAAPTTANPDGFVDAGHGVFVPAILLDIRYCESRDNYTAANPSSSARGAYQFLTGSWESYGHADRYGVAQAHLATPAQQDEAALITWQRDGTRPWNASSYCWG